MRAVWIFLFAFSGISAQVFYEEHFAGGVPELQWYPFFFGNDTIQVIEDSSAPDFDDWVGYVGGDFLGLAFAGDPNLDNYSIEAWLYLDVTSGSGGPYQGIALRVDYTNMQFFNFIADLDNSRRLRLAYIDASDTIPNTTTIKEWQESEITGGLPTETGWHKMKVTVIGDSLWCYFDEQLLPGSPYIYSGGPSKGYFGAYYFIFVGSAYVKIDSIIAAEPSVKIEEKEEKRPLTILRISPNPFKDKVVFETTDGEGFKTLHVYSPSGRRVRTLVPIKIGGVFQYIWNGRDKDGREVAPGMYLLLSKDRKESIKLIKLR